MNFDLVNNRKGTYCSQWDYVQDRFGVPNLLPFTISDMDFKSPDLILEKLQDIVQKGIFGYTRWAHEDYFGAIKHWYQSRFSYSLSSSWIGYSPNVIYALVQCLELCNPSKAPVFLFTPSYDGFKKVLDGNHFPIKKMHLDREEIFKEESFSEAVHNCGCLLLCNPNNPNGRLWTEEELSIIVRVCKKKGIWIISDDIHMDFVYAPKKFTPIFRVSEQEDYLHRTIIISSAAKTFNSSGLGGAYVLIPNLEVLSSFLDTLKSKDALSSPMILGMHTLMTGYWECEKWVDSLCAYCHGNLQYVQDALNPIKGISAPLPDATYFSWIDASGLGMTQDELQQHLVEKGKVAIIRGDAYEEKRVFLRMNIAAPRSKIEDGVNRLLKTIQ